MNTTKIIETTVATIAVVAFAAAIPATGAMAAGLLIFGALATMAALEGRTRAL